MTATSQIYPFATGAGANVLTPADYQEADYRQQGFQDGIVESFDYNTVARQTSFVAASLAQFVVNATDSSVLDNGDVNGLAGQIADALRGSLGPAVPHYARDTSTTANRVTITVPALTGAAPEGATFLVRINVDSAGPATFKINNRPSVAITYGDGSALKGRALKAGAMMLFSVSAEGPVQLHGVVTPAPSTSRVYFGRDSGTANTYVVTAANCAPAPSELVAGTFLVLQPKVANTGGSSLTFAEFGPAPIVRGTATPLSAGDILPGDLLLLAYDGASWQAKYLSSFAAGSLYPAVERPVNVTPAANALNVSVTTALTGSAYYSLYQKTQTAAQFQVSLDPTFATTAIDQTVNSATVTYTVTAGALTTAKTYYWRLRYQNVAGVWSDWSVPTAFTTGATATYVNAPSITTPANNEPAAPLKPLLTSSAFSVTGGSDTQNGSQWQIARDPQFTNIVYDSGIVADTVSHQVTATLSGQIDYYARARHRGATLGFGSYSNAVTFRTRAQPDRPTITAPVDGATKVPLKPTITASSFSMPGGGVHAATQWQVDNDADFSSPVFDSGDDGVNLTSKTLAGGVLVFDQDYYIRVRYKESGGAYSAYSLPVKIHTVVTTPISELFAAVTYTGTNAPRSVSAGIDLATKGGTVINRARRAATDTLDAVTNTFSTTRGPGKYIPGCTDLDYERAFNDASYGITGFTNSGFTLGFSQAAVNEAGVPALAYLFAKAAGFYHEVVVTKTVDGPQDFDLSALGGTIGMVQACPLLVPQTPRWYGWHRGSGGGGLSLALDRPDTSPNSGYPVTVAGSTVTLTAPVYQGQILLRVWGHNPSADGLQQFGQTTLFGSNPSVVTIGFRPQLIAIKDADTVSDWFFMDTARGMGAGDDAVLPLNSGNAEYGSGFDPVTPLADGFRINAGVFNPGRRLAWWAIRAAD